VTILFGGIFMGSKKKTDGLKPKCRLVGEDGNIFFVLGRVRQALKASGKNDQVQEVSERVMASGSYDEALRIIMEYVDVE
jgi:hypothetical protein